MFEKFTQKAIDVVQAAQNYAQEFCHTRVLSQHLLLGLVAQSKGVQAKILNFDKIHFGELTIEVHQSTQTYPDKKNNDNIFFSSEARDILKSAVELSNELNSKFIMPQHIALAIFQNKNCGAYKIIKKFDIDEERIIPNLKRMLDKSSDITSLHPETENENTQLSNINDFFKEKIMSEILANAQSKVSASGYEILGSEQLLQSILENKDYKIVEILNKFDINSENFNEKLSQFNSRTAEFENSEKQIIFTPNAFSSLLLALDYAKESGSVGIQPEHVILGILKAKKGIAYKILSQAISNAVDFEDIVLKKLNDKIPETLAILKLAKEEARSLNCETVGTEMILLGILSYGAGIASDTLRRLGINLKDARKEVEKLIKPQKEVKTLSYSPRAKKMLEVAYKTAHEHKRNKIKSENILYGITKMPNCLAMQVLSNLGTDVLEIQQGIKQELLGGMDL
ncbi:MAG: hypothetical protein IJB79_06980 [Candidatus Gastranaerophilales bacterium]|nr:hypothetical protein [Candidatus Gastranaerophilales bacterium]